MKIANVFDNQNRNDYKIYLLTEVHKKRTQLLRRQICCESLLYAIFILLFFVLSKGGMNEICTGAETILLGWANKISEACTETNSVTNGCDLVFDGLRGMGQLSRVVLPIVVYGSFGSLLLILLYYKVIYPCTKRNDTDGRTGKSDELMEQIEAELPDGEMKKLKIGIDGEKIACSIVEQSMEEGTAFLYLDEDYRKRDGNTNSDLIIVSPTGGVTYCWVMTHDGILSGNFSDPIWIQEITPEDSIVVKEKIYNPMKVGCSPRLSILRNLMKEGVLVNIRECVLFVNEHVALDFSDYKEGCGEIPFFTVRNREKFLSYLTQSNDPPLYDMEVQRIEDSMMLCIMNSFVAGTSKK